MTKLEIVQGYQTHGILFELNLNILYGTKLKFLDVWKKSKTHLQNKAKKMGEKKFTNKSWEHAKL